MSCIVCVLFAAVKCSTLNMSSMIGHVLFVIHGELSYRIGLAIPHLKLP